MDITSPVAAAAPTYSDLKIKQVPVKALGVGDILEYALRSTEQKSEVNGQFWYEQTLLDNVVNLNQSLEIQVPKDKYVQVFSPKLKSETRDQSGQRVYLWKYSQLEPSKPEKKRSAGDKEVLKVDITTFRNWEEVGKWWGTLAAEQSRVTPPIQAKANELTAGLSTDDQKARALYSYVALKFSVHLDFLRRW